MKVRKMVEPASGLLLNCGPRSCGAHLYGPFAIGHSYRAVLLPLTGQIPFCSSSSTDLMALRAMDFLKLQHSDKAITIELCAVGAKGR